MLTPNSFNRIGIVPFIRRTSLSPLAFLAGLSSSLVGTVKLDLRFDVVGARVTPFFASSSSYT